MKNEMVSVVEEEEFEGNQDLCYENKSGVVIYQTSLWIFTL